MDRLKIFVKKFLRNKNLPICNNCLYFFIEHKNNYPYDFYIYKLYGKCKKFGEIDNITGVIKYDFASICRTNICKCGINGSEYKNKN